MKKYFLIIIAISLYLLNSCSDIVNSDPNGRIIIKDDLPGLSKVIEYDFAADILVYHNNDSTALWTAYKPGVWGKIFYITNRSKDSIFKIENVSLRDSSTKFSLIFPPILPVNVVPNQENNSNKFTITLKTKDLEPGIYNNKIIINNNPQTGFYVRVNVRNN